MSSDGSGDTASNRDEQLRLARRVDWRFLLPSPRLGRVGVLGAPDDDLRDALEFESIGPELDRGGFDTVVVTGTIERETLGRAAAAVSPNGRMVVEVSGPWTRSLVARRGNSPGVAVRVARILAAADFGDVRTWWMWPDRARARAWVRLDDRPALEALIDGRTGGRAGPLGSRLAARLVAGDAVTSLLPALTIVASHDRSPGMLERRLGDDDPTTGGMPPGLMVVTPRFRASAHVVGLSIDSVTRSIRRVAKVARLVDDTSLQREASVLAALAHGRGDTGRHPTLIDAPGLATDVGGETWPVLVESGVAGSPLSPAVVRADRAEALRGIVGWLETLPVSDPSQRLVPVAGRLADAIATVERSSHGQPRLLSLVARTRSVIGPLGDVPLPKVFEHGDAAHPNLLRDEDGRVGAVDWERGVPDGLPLHDLTIALAYVAAAARGATKPTAQATAFRRAMSGPDPWAREVLDAEVARLGIPPETGGPLMVAAWLRTVAWLAGHLAGDKSTVEWLLGDRSVALWASALDLAEAG